MDHTKLTFVDKLSSIAGKYCHNFENCNLVRLIDFNVEDGDFLEEYSASDSDPDLTDEPTDNVETELSTALSYLYKKVCSKRTGVENCKDSPKKSTYESKISQKPMLSSLHRSKSSEYLHSNPKNHCITPHRSHVNNVSNATPFEIRSPNTALFDPVGTMSRWGERATPIESKFHKESRHRRRSHYPTIPQSAPNPLCKPYATTVDHTRVPYHHSQTMQIDRTNGGALLDITQTVNLSGLPITPKTPRRQVEHDHLHRLPTVCNSESETLFSPKLRLVSQSPKPLNRSSSSRSSSRSQSFNFERVQSWLREQRHFTETQDYTDFH